mmetsp:Transcript_37483/g.45778  ORF Transcript_37483/g.45778 Transcript_37483/m.45778 type:complete len:135 (+) Transcript_37483:50-454(+)
MSMRHCRSTFTTSRILNCVVSILSIQPSLAWLGGLKLPSARLFRRTITRGGGLTPLQKLQSVQNSNQKKHNAVLRTTELFEAPQQHSSDVVTKQHPPPSNHLTGINKFINGVSSSVNDNTFVFLTLHGKKNTQT